MIILNQFTEQRALELSKWTLHKIELREEKKHKFIHRDILLNDL